MSIIAWIVVGAIAGWIASKVVPGDEDYGVLGGLIAGIVGAIVGGFLFGAADQHGLDDRHQHPHAHRRHRRRDHRGLRLEHDHQATGGTHAV